MVTGSNIKNDSETNPARDSARGLNGYAFIATLSMTYLTIAKELVLYQNEHHNWRSAVYKLAMNGYYPLLIVNLVFLLWMVWRRKIEKRPSVLLGGAIVIFLINIALFSANNIANVLSGNPLHGLHHGIGW